MAQLKLEILLPLYHNPDENGTRTKIEDREFSETYQDIIKQFGGCTVNPATQTGGWINPETGEEITDELALYWVVYEDTDQNRDFLKNFKEVLKKRFKQDEIMMYSVTVTRI